MVLPAVRCVCESEQAPPEVNPNQSFGPFVYQGPAFTLVTSTARIVQLTLIYVPKAFSQ